MWPDYYPEYCPPDDSDDCSGKVFRIIKGETASEADFVPYIIEFFGDPNFQSCKSAGLSVCVTLEAAKTKLEQPKFAGQYIAVLELPASAGKMKQARQSAHATWWVPRDVSPLDYVCEVVEI